MNDDTARKDKEHLEVRRIWKSIRITGRECSFKEMIKRREAMHWSVRAVAFRLHVLCFQSWLSSDHPETVRLRLAPVHAV